MRDHEHLRSDLTGIVPYPLRVPAVGDFEAWIETQAARLRVPATVIFRDAGVRWAPDGNAIWMVRIDDEALFRLAAFTSNTPEAINATLLGSWDGGPLDLTGLTARNVRVFATKSAASFGSTKFCPAHVAAGEWSLRWRHQLVVACAEHRCLLESTCAGCGTRVRLGKTRKLGPPTAEQATQPGNCTNLIAADGDRRSLDRSLCCRYPLGSTPALDLPTDSDLFAAQSEVNTWFDRWDTTRDLDVGVLFRSTRSILSLAAYALEPGDVDPGAEYCTVEWERFCKTRDSAGGCEPIPWSTARWGAGITGALLGFAVNYVTSTGRSHTDYVDLLAGRVAERRRRLHNAKSAEWGFGLQGDLAAEWVDALAATRNPGVSRTVRHAAPDTTNLAAADVVPASMPDEYHQLFDGLIPDTLEDTARMFESLTVCRIVTGAEWADCAQVFGLPARLAKSRVETISNRINEAGTGRRFLDAAMVATAHLERDARDYGTARRVLAAAVDLDHGWWADVCSDNRVNAGHLGVRSRYAATWLWADATGGDWRHAPALVAHEAQLTRHSARLGYLRFLDWLPDTITTALRDLAATAIGTGEW